MPVNGGKWVLTDPVSGYSYQLAINPNSEVITAGKTFQFEATAAPGGALLLYEGTDQPTTIQWGGTILSQSQYSAMEYFHQLRNQFEVQDDAGRELWVYSSEWNPTRVRSALYPFKFTYQWTLFLLQENLSATPVWNADPWPYGVWKQNGVISSPPTGVSS